MHQPAFRPVSPLRPLSAHVPQPAPDTIPRPMPEPPPQPLDLPGQIPPEIQEPVLPGEHSPVGEPWVPVAPTMPLH